MDLKKQGEGVMDQYKVW